MIDPITNKPYGTDEHRPSKELVDWLSSLRDAFSRLRRWSELDERRFGAVTERLSPEPADVLTVLRDARSMLNTVAECATHECEDCREHAAKHRDAIDAVLYGAQRFTEKQVYEAFGAPEPPLAPKAWMRVFPDGHHEVSYDKWREPDRHERWTVVPLFEQASVPQPAVLARLTECELALHHYAPHSEYFLRYELGGRPTQPPSGAIAALRDLVEANDDYINGDAGFPFADALERAKAFLSGAAVTKASTLEERQRELPSDAKAVLYGRMRELYRRDTPDETEGSP